MAHGSYGQVLHHRGFRAFLWTQFFGAFNDNIYRTMVALGALHLAGGKYVSAVLAVFVFPSLLFSGYAGHLADALSKRTVLIWVKAFEIGIMLLGLGAFLTNHIEGMLIVVFLMGLHSAIFSPAKYGIVPEIMPEADLSRANALLEMSTFLAIVLGQASGAFVYAVWKGAAWRMGAVALAVAVAGFLTSLRITRVPASGTKVPFRWNPFAEVADGTRTLLRDRPLWLAVLAIAYFWFVAALLQPALERFGDEVLHASDLRIGLLWTFVAIGLGAGNLLAGKLSGDKVELGLVPLGSLLIGLFAMGLAAAGGSYGFAVAMLVPLAGASGLFAVPLYAFVQQRTGAQEKGRIIATSNFYQTLAMMIAAGAVWGFHDLLGVSSAAVLAGLGVLTLAVTAYILTVVPDYFLRFCAWMLTHSLFRIRVRGERHVPFHGPVLLVSNHMSHVDGFLISACVQRFIRFLVWRPYYDAPGLGWLFRLAQAIPVGSGGRQAIESIRAARRALAAGDVVCIFAEGAISRTGNMLPFKRGLEKIVAGMDVPVIPVHLDRLWGSIFSFERGRFFWKWPKRVPFPVTVSFGAPLESAKATAGEVRQTIQELGAEAWAERKSQGDRLDLRFIAQARRDWNRLALSDSTGKELSFGRALAGAHLLARWIARNRPAEEMMAVLLPASVGGALANAGITLSGRAAVNLNFTAGAEAMASAMEQLGARTILTSRVFLEKAKIAATPEMVLVEDILAGFGAVDRLLALAAARWLPARSLARGKGGPDQLATVIFSSGSTGTPKGVMLSHHNVLANIDAIAQVFWLGGQDRIAGVLPLFHAFGYTMTVWFPLIVGCGVAYHPNPLDARAVGRLVEKYRATIMIATPTFLANYTRKCEAHEFATLRLVLVGAEKLRPAIAAAFREKFSVTPLEGYGTTEMGPVVAVNVPDVRADGETQIGNKPGTAGHPLPGVAARIVDAVSFAPLPPGREGLILVKGCNRMQGYWGQPERTREVLRESWYVTGDIGLIDDEGFLSITDRLTRFSKIGGEMVPHFKIEEAITAAVPETSCAVTAIPDEDRGERLVVLYTAELAPGEVWQRLNQTALPKLWIPKRENFYRVETLPLLATGKLDLRGVKAQAQQLARVAVG
jgi:acyl-[acyl-carrier-protein]-phospholipid O-acyltransferase/long-chain-fatty-acid--[acyl-carrier-protein] ligase